MTKNQQSSKKLLKSVEKLHSKGIDLGLDRFQTLLSRLGNPHQKVQPVIHVAGTNGKGSTIAILRACFEAVGYRVHSFISPHLVRPHECINLDGEEISEPFFAELLGEVIEANDGAALTVFEALTAAAFLAYSRTKGHILLLETGLGGLGDTTNVIEKPLLTAITPIANDHAEFLGESLYDIATHKAGIIKQGVPCVIAKQDDDAYQAIRERAKELNAPMYRQGREWFVKKAGDRMVFEGWDGDNAWPRPSLKGDHQIQNAGVALACLEVLKDQYNLPIEAVQNGLQSVSWPGRLEQYPCEDLLDEGWELWLDGGHNEHAARALRQQLKKWDDKPTYMICGMLKSKDSKAYMDLVAEKVDHVIAVPIPKMDSRKPKKLANLAEEAGSSVSTSDDVFDALKKIQKKAERPGRVLVCGSLYLLGYFLKTIEKK